MATVRATVNNNTNNGQSRGGYYFPPRAKGIKVETTNAAWCEITACEDLEIESVELDSDIADIASVLPDGLLSETAIVDEDKGELGNNNGLASQGGASATVQTEEDQVPATKEARLAAEEAGLSLVEIYENTTPSGAGGKLNKNDVKAYADGNQSEENQPEEGEGEVRTSKDGGDGSGEQETNDPSNEGGHQGDNEVSASEDAQRASDKAAEASEDAERASKKSSRKGT